MYVRLDSTGMGDVDMGVVDLDATQGNVLMIDVDRPPAPKRPHSEISASVEETVEQQIVVVSPTGDIELQAPRPVYDGPVEGVHYFNDSNLKYPYVRGMDGKIYALKGDALYPLPPPKSKGKGWY